MIKCQKDPTYAIFFNSWWFKSYIPMCSIHKWRNTDTNKNTNTQIQLVVGWFFICLKCIFPKCIFAKCTQLTSLRVFLIPKCLQDNCRPHFTLPWLQEALYCKRSVACQGLWGLFACPRSGLGWVC